MPAYREVRVLSVAEAAYLGGLIDGEDRARLALRGYVRLTPRNGKYSQTLLAERAIFESTLPGLRAAAKKEPPQPRG
jgi:hypothetical protein